MYKSFREERANGKCLICDQQAVTGVAPGQDGHEFICRRCGAYRVTEEFVWELPQPDSPLFEFRYRIGFAFRTASERIKDIRDLPFHPSSEVLVLLNQRDPTVDEKLGNLLSFLARNSAGPGKYAFFDSENDHTIICARDGDESTFLLESLVQDGLVQVQEQALEATGFNYRVATAGRSELTRRERAGADSNFAFIAMSFATERASIGLAIGNAVAAAGYVPLRMDQIEHSNRIDDEILARLRSSKFLVVDLTLQNPGAYFEAGFMLGLGRHVIWTCSSDDLENVHFDTRQYNIIDYEGEADLSKRLQLRIEAVIGKGEQISA
jgi:hypothetical protein